MGSASADFEASLLLAAATGEDGALASLFNIHRKRLLRMVHLRLDRRLRSRIDPVDVLQEAFIDLAREFPRYAQRSELPVFLWLRLVTLQRLMRLHRKHLGAGMRDAAREVSLDPSPGSGVDAMAEAIADDLTTPSQAAQRSERRAILREALEAMGPVDREVIAMRHFDGLSNDEVAQALGLTKAGASNRYVRAMTRLQAGLARSLGLADRS